MIVEKMMEEWKVGLRSEFDLQPAIDEMGTRKLLDVLLNNVGNTNSLLRENVLGAFCSLARDKPVLSHEEYIHALDTCLSDTHLFNGIGGAENDTAFWRGFASNYVMWIIYADAKQGFLSHDEYMRTLDKSIEYMTRETDRRGFVYGKGTIHAIPHGTGMFQACIEHPKFPHEYVNSILDAIKCNVVDKGRFAPDWADSGLAQIIPVLLGKDVSEDTIKEWIESLLPDVDAAIYTDEHYPYVLLGSNIEHFLMFVYFELKKKEMNDGLREWIFEYLPKLRERVYS